MLPLNSGTLGPACHCLEAAGLEGGVGGWRSLQTGGSSATVQQKWLVYAEWGFPSYFTGGRR